MLYSIGLLPQSDRKERTLTRAHSQIRYNSIMDTVAAFVKDVYDQMPQQAKYVAGGVAVGAAAVPLAGMGAAAAIPWAMSTFGTVVPGVGTIHAAGGVAATLQWASTAFTGAAAWYGAAAGAAAASRVPSGDGA